MARYITAFGVGDAEFRPGCRRSMNEYRPTQDQAQPETSFDASVRSDDPQRAVGKLAVGIARHKASGVCVAFSVESAKSVLAPIVFYFEVVGDGFALKPVAEDHFIIRVLKLKATQHTQW